MHVQLQYGLGCCKCLCFRAVQGSQRHARGTAGLWEFPSQTVAADASQKQRRAAVDALLQRLLGDALKARTGRERCHLGAITHIFSHIRMTLQAERLLLEARA